MGHAMPVNGLALVPRVTSRDKRRLGLTAHTACEVMTISSCYWMITYFYLADMAGTCSKGKDEGLRFAALKHTARYLDPSWGEGLELDLDCASYI